MYSKRKLQMGVAVAMALAACSDRVDGPVGPVALAAVPIVLGAGNPADQGKITVTRTTDVRVPGDSGREGGAQPRVSRRQQTIVMGTGRVAIRHEDARILAALKAKVIDSVMRVNDLPVTGLSFAAGAPSLRESVLPWHESFAVPGELEGTIEMTGIGDAPPSTIRYMRGGVAVLIVSQEWELWKRQWNLVRREAVMTDGSMREVIEVARTDRAGAAVESSLEWAQGGVRIAGPVAFDMFNADESAPCDMCATLRLNAMEALASSLVKDVFAGMACALAPAGVTLPACAAALSVAADALVKVARAAYELQQCVSNPPPCPKKEPATDCTKRAAHGRGAGPSFDCASPTDDGVSGGTGGPSTPSGHWECTYYYQYDLNTGEVLFSQLLYCSWLGGP